MATLYTTHVIYHDILHTMANLLYWTVYLVGLAYTGATDFGDDFNADEVLDPSNYTVPVLQERLNTIGFDNPSTRKAAKRKRTSKPNARYK